MVPEGEPPSLDDLRDHLEAAGLSRQFWPERLELVQSMPRTPAGKIQKYLLRELVADQSSATRRIQ